jgi:hypothetical protein
VVVDGRSPNAQRKEQRRPTRSRDSVDWAVGSAASVLGMLVVLASIPSPSRTGLMATTGVLFGVFGYLLGSRRLGTAAIMVSAVVILTWLLV